MTMEAVETARTQADQNPKNAAMRTALAMALEDEGLLEEAIVEYMAALVIKPGYKRAALLLESCQKDLADAQSAEKERIKTEEAATVGITAPDPPCVISDVKNNEEEEGSVQKRDEEIPLDEAAVVAASVAKKNEGNAAFASKEYDTAVKLYTEAIKILATVEKRDAKYHSNRAASNIARKKYVAAALDGLQSSEIDPDWWKGFWYRGQSLLRLLEGKKPSTAMTERAEQAKIAFDKCLKCSTLPDGKRGEIEAAKMTASNIIMGMVSDCNQQ